MLGWTLATRWRKLYLRVEWKPLLNLDKKNCITLQGPVSYFFLWTHEMGFGTCNIVKGTNLLLAIVALHADTTASFYSFYVQHSSITLTVTGSCFSSRESPHFRFAGFALQERVNTWGNDLLQLCTRNSHIRVYVYTIGMENLARVKIFSH